MIWTADSVEYRSIDCKAAYSGETLLWVKNTEPVAKEVTTLSTADTYIIIAGDRIAVTDDLVYNTGYPAPATSTMSLQDVYFNSTHQLIGYIPPNAFKFKVQQRDSYNGKYKIVESGSGYELVVNGTTGSLYLSSYYSGNLFFINKNLAREDKVVRSVGFYNIYYEIASGGGAYTSYYKNWNYYPAADGYTPEMVYFRYIKNWNTTGGIPRIYRIL